MGRSLPSSDLDPRCSSQAFLCHQSCESCSFPFPLWRPDSDCAAALSLLQRLVWTRPPSRVPKLRCHQGCQQRTGPPALSSSSNEGTAISKPRFLYRYIMYIVQSLRRGFGMKKSTTFDTLDRLQKYSSRARCRLESSTLFSFSTSRGAAADSSTLFPGAAASAVVSFFALLFRGFPSVRYGKGCYVSAVSFD